MREVELKFVTEVLDPRTGFTWTYPRFDDHQVQFLEDHGFIVSNTEHEIPPVNEE